MATSYWHNLKRNKSKKNRFVPEISLLKMSLIESEKDQFGLMGEGSDTTGKWCRQMDASMYGLIPMKKVHIFYMSNTREVYLLCNSPYMSLVWYPLDSTKHRMWLLQKGKARKEAKQRMISYTWRLEHPESRKRTWRLKICSLWNGGQRGCESLCQ